MYNKEKVELHLNRAEIHLIRAQVFAELGTDDMELESERGLEELNAAKRLIEESGEHND